jgi:N-acetylneuraminate synthase
MHCFLIAEAGVNHNGSEQLAVQLVEAAAASGADAVKFQTFSAEKLVRPGTQTAAYQMANANLSDQFEMLKALELPEAALPRLKARADALGIEFMSTPFDLEAARLLVGLGMRRIKVPSGEITNLPFLEQLAQFDLPLIVSTGMADIEEVAQAVDAIASSRGERTVPLHERVTLLHCTSNYPTAAQDVNLRAMHTLAARFRVPVGYSDHTQGTAISIAAAALGATVIEKHFTIDRALPGPDHKASLSVEELRQMVLEVREVATALGDGIKAPCAKELAVRDVVRRSVVLTRDKRAGEPIAPDDVVLLRPGTGIAPRDLRKVLGRRAARGLAAGALLAWEDLTD